MKVNVLIDASGSMTENGKISIMKYVINAVEGYSAEEESIDLSLYLYQWGDSIEHISNVGEFRSKEGTVEGDVIKFVSEHSKEAVLIISDGGFSRKMKREFRQLQTRENIYFVGVGCDCNFPAIRSLTDDKNVFRAQDIITCLKNMMYVEK